MSQAAISGALDYQGDVTAEPLTPSEVKLLHRLLSDPSVLPRDFKQWVTDHSSDTVDIAKSQVHGLIGSTGALIFSNASWEQLGAALCPMIVPYPATVAPANWLFCDGAMLLEADFPVLFSFLGHAHDIAVSTGSFGVPDLRGRSIYGFDPTSGTGTVPFAGHDTYSVGGRGPRHHHTVPDHQHGMNHSHGLGYNYYASGGAGGVAGGGSDTFTGPSTLAATSPGGGGSTSGPPTPVDGGGWYGLNYIIASGRIP